jgi:general secretion pathway protein A
MRPANDSVPEPAGTPTELAARVRIFPVVDAKIPAPAGPTPSPPAPDSRPLPDPEPKHVQLTVPEAAADQPEPVAPSPAAGRDEKTIPAPRQPERLGKLIVEPGDTLVSLIRRVYGARNNALLRAVIEANPHIVNPNVIDVGNVLTFPALPRKIETAGKPSTWIHLGDYESLAEALQRVNRITTDTPIPVQMIPYWSPEGGLRFCVLIRKIFETEKVAADYAEALPANITGHGRVIHDWPEATVFYSNPYHENGN